MKRLCRICKQKLSSYNSSFECFHHEIDRKLGKNFNRFQDCSEVKSGSRTGDLFLHTHLFEEGYSEYQKTF